MNISHQKVEIIEQGPDILSAYKVIEKAARVCYKSEDKITEDSYKGMLAMLKANGHFSALEHGTIYLAIPITGKLTDPVKRAIKIFTYNPYSRSYIDDTILYVTTNYRVIVEHELEELCDKYISKCTNYHTPRITAHFISDISVNREANRHRVNSINEESTIYCNYAKDKFGNEITISKPVWITDEEIAGSIAFDIYGFDRPFETICQEVYNAEKVWSAIDYWVFANLACEFCYMNLIRLGWKPKQARTILPLDTKSELIHTAYIDEWINFFYWRCTEAHPQIKDLACKLRDLFVRKGLAPKDVLYNPQKLIVK